MLNRLFKKLDVLIVKAFIGPFVATFFITLFVLVLQFMWLYIDDVVGKGLDTITVLRLLMYVAATVVPLALPLAVLLSSIMTLGNLGETYELVAIKSAGISLLRFLRPLFFVSIGITLIAFYFNNNILPVANLKMNTLKYDIIVSKPAFDIKEGVFYDRIEGFVIKIGKKERDDSTIRNVVIYEQNNNGQQDNMIIADSGIMVVSPNKQSLIFTLKAGSRYQEDGERNVNAGTRLTRMQFKAYKKVMDLSSFRLNKTDDSTFKGNFQMLTIVQLGRAIDSIKKTNARFIQQAALGASAGLKFPAYLDTTGWKDIGKSPDAGSKYLLPIDSVRDSLRRAWVVALRKQDSTDKAQDSIRSAQKAIAKAAADKAAAAAKDSAAKAATAKSAAAKDTAKAATKSVASSPGHPTGGTATSPPANTPASAPVGTPAIPPGQAPPSAGSTPFGSYAGSTSRVPATAPEPSFTDLLPDSVRLSVLDRAINTINASKTSLYQPVALYANEEHVLLLHEEAWHEKLTLAVACLVMFLIGAPLGSIIRKGGIGMPLVFAVIFFVIFFLLNNFGKKFVGGGVLSPLAGMWMPTYVLTPIGLFLVYKALNDSQLFNKEFYFRMTKKIRPLFAAFSRKQKQTTELRP